MQIDTIEELDDYGKALFLRLEALRNASDDADLPQLSEKQLERINAFALRDGMTG